MEFNENEKSLLKFSLEFLIQGIYIIPSKKLRKQNLNKVIMVNDCKKLLNKFN